MRRSLGRIAFLLGRFSAEPDLHSCFSQQVPNLLRGGYPQQPTHAERESSSCKSNEYLSNSREARAASIEKRGEYADCRERQHAERDALNDSGHPR